ncbi:UNVERIFIED_ORG: copper resistance protein CopC (plasmid) [Roseateles sp. XES5]|nr:CopD family protein [Roseateles sp. XES5]
MRDHLGRSCTRAVLAAVLWCCLAVTALAHASLTGAVPADGALVDAAPKTLSLSFSEPVSPLVLRLIQPDGQTRVLETFVLRDRTLEIAAPGDLATGTHVLVWRVVSEDGHPVAGSTIFSIGAPSSAPPAAGEAIDWSVRIALWITRIAIYAGLFFGIGGLFAIRWLIPGGIDGLPLIRLALLLGMSATVLSLGLQGLDALGVPLSSLRDQTVWRAGIGTSFGTTVTVISPAFLLAIVASSRAGLVGRAASLVAMLLASAALALSGHASSATPQWLMRPAVFVHVIAIAIWIGSLLPLAYALQCESDTRRQALGRFSRIIPVFVAALTTAGLLLAVVQVQDVGPLFSTAYGNVLLAKTALLAILFLLVATNRWVLTNPVERGEHAAAARLARAVVAEILIVLAIFAVAAMWRFTPPPRALLLVAAQPASIHIHSDKAMAEVTVTPGRAGPVDVSAIILAPDFSAIIPKEVTFVLSNPRAGIEAMRRKATLQTSGVWLASDVVVPIAGEWRLRVDILISDFELVRLQDTIKIAR